jgi:hypothetical protein
MTGAGIAPEAVARAVGDGLGPDVLSGTADLLPVVVPGVEQVAVWLVRDDRLDHPLQAYVGRWPDGTVRVLSDDQTAWTELMAAVGVRIEDPGTALGYVRQFLEVTRGPSVIVHEVAGPEDLQWRPGSADEEARRSAFLAEHLFQGPVTGRTDDGFHVELTLVVDQRVQRNAFDVATDGTVRATFQVIAEDLPLPIAR